MYPLSRDNSQYGSFQGIVTLEGLIEEIVGEIEDELDRPAEAVVPLSEGRVRIEGTLSVDEFNERFGQELPRGHYHTIAGFAFGQLGHGAQVGDEVFVDGVCFRVVEVEGSRIVRLEAEFGLSEACLAWMRRHPRSWCEQSTVVALELF